MHLIGQYSSNRIHSFKFQTNVYVCVCYIFLILFYSQQPRRGNLMIRREIIINQLNIIYYFHSKLVLITTQDMKNSMMIIRIE